MLERRTFQLLAFSMAVLACGAGTAHAQNIIASPASLMFNVTVRGATSAPSVVQITSTGAQFSFFASVSPNTPAPWLVINQTSNVTPGSISVSVNPSVLISPGTLSSSILITGVGGTSAIAPIMIPVTVVVTGSTQAVVSPSSLSFTSQAGSVTPPTIINISTGGAAGTFLISPVSLGNWLSVDRTNGVTPSDVLVSVNPGSLAPGTYTGSLQITVPGAANSPVTVPVTLTVASAAQLSAAPSALNFVFQLGQLAPAPQQLFVSAGGGSVPFNATASTANGNSTWLVVNSATGTTPGIAMIGVNPAGLAAGVYNGTLTITSVNAPNITVPVTLTVSAQPLLIPTPSTISFNYQTGGQPLQQATLALASTSGTIGYTAAVTTTNGGPWLQVSPTLGSTPSSISVIADPTSLAPGVYNGTITLTLTGSGASTATIPVTLTVATTPMLTASPATVSFFSQVGGASPNAQVITVGSTSGSLSFSSVATTTTGTNWLTATGSGSASPGVPGQITVTANPGTLAPGMYTGFVTISSPSAVAIQVPVSLTVSTLPLLTVAPTAFAFTYQTGAPVPAAQTLSVGSTTAGINFAIVATTMDGANWLSVSQTTGSTPLSVSVTVNPTGLRPGTYSGMLAVSSPGAGNLVQNVTVSLTVTGAAITVSPTALNFTQQMGGPAPAAQILSLSNTTASTGYTVVGATATGGGNWLVVMPANGSTPGQVSVSVNGAGLAQGTYTGTVTITPATPFGATGGIVTVPVTLVIGSAPQTLTLSAASLNFGYQAGGTVPAAQTVSVTGTSALPFTVAVATTSGGGGWLAASPLSGTAGTSGTTGAPIAVSVNPAGLVAGTYTGTVTVAATGASNSPQTIPVTLVVTSVPPPSLTALVNAASFLNGPVAPGEIVTLGGTGIGPATLAGLQLTASGTVDTTVAGTRVLFDGIPAPIIYVSATQTSVVVPYALAGRATAQAQIVVNGVASNLFGVAIAPSAPAIFTLNSAGSGPGAILNQNGSVNSSASPSATGQVIVIYATGEGATNPGGTDGAVIGADLRNPLLPVTVTIGGQPAQVNYAGSAPGLVAGVLQVNAVVPPGAGTGNVNLTIKVGSNSSQPNVTVFLQ